MFYVTGKNETAQTGFVADTVYGHLMTANFLRASAEDSNDYTNSADGIHKFARACDLKGWSKGNQRSTIPSKMYLQFICDRKTHSNFENGILHNSQSHGVLTSRQRFIWREERFRTRRSDGRPISYRDGWANANKFSCGVQKIMWSVRQR